LTDGFYCFLSVLWSCAFMTFNSYEYAINRQEGKDNWHPLKQPTYSLVYFSEIVLVRFNAWLPPLLFSFITALHFSWKFIGKRFLDTVFNATLNYFSAISDYPEKTTDLSQVTDKLYHIMLCTSPWLVVEPTTSVVIGTDYKGSCKLSSLLYTLVENLLVSVFWILVLGRHTSRFVEKKLWFQHKCSAIDIFSILNFLSDNICVVFNWWLCFFRPWKSPSWTYCW
jgi:hypothetical protein